jgi:hypothetical protein
MVVVVGMKSQRGRVWRQERKKGRMENETDMPARLYNRRISKIFQF